MKIFLFLLLLTAGSVQAAPPNIVLILVDDMGYGDPGCYNPDSKIPTPHIDSLARDGMRFTDAHAPGPLCHVSRYGLLTGRYPWRAEFKWSTTPVIKEGQATIASLLKSRGYATSMVGKWHLGFEERGGGKEDYTGVLSGGPADRGFEKFFGIRASTDIPPYFYIRGDRAVKPPTDRISANNTDGWTNIQGKFWREGGIAPDLKLDEVTPRFTEEALTVIGAHSELKEKKPLFLYLAYPGPHTPWLPSPEFVGKSGADLYGDFAHMIDAEIGRVLKGLDDAKMREDTLVIFTVDNGPVWFEQDVEKYGHDSSGGLRGMKAGAWEGGHRMPFIVRWPGTVKPGSETGQAICFTDLLATFASLTGAALPDKAGPDSFDISKVLKGEQPVDKPVRGPIVMQAGGNRYLVREGDWKLINARGSGGFSRRFDKKSDAAGPPAQLYNLREDLGETKNLWEDKPEIVARLTKRLAEIRAGEATRSF